MRIKALLTALIKVSLQVTEAKDKVKFGKITGYIFKDSALVKRALTHSSIENSSRGNYERLEFLGDRVLGLVMAELLCDLFPDAPEGILSARLNMLVNAEICAEIAVETGLSAFIVMSADMKQGSARRMVNIYADVMEALIAALYVEGGLIVARRFIIRYWTKRAQDSALQRRDAKTELQEWAHKQKAGELPHYRLVKRKGPDHDPVFEMEVLVSGFAPASGKGASKRQAEQAAAEIMLRRENIWI